MAYMIIWWLHAWFDVVLTSVMQIFFFHFHASLRRPANVYTFYCWNKLGRSKTQVVAFKSRATALVGWNSVGVGASRVALGQTNCVKLYLTCGSRGRVSYETGPWQRQARKWPRVPLFFTAQEFEVCGFPQASGSGTLHNGISSLKLDHTETERDKHVE